jgi:SAM-dependent methyltransferase
MARLRRLVQNRAEPKLLDYGSGFGRWARAAVREGFSVTAFEPSAVRAKEKKEVEFEVVHDLSVLQGRTFDVVNVEQVLEHIPDPVSALRAMRCLGNEETIFRFTDPNILRPSEGRKIWEVWPFHAVHAHTLAPFEHLHGFTPKSLGLALERSGFKSVEASALWKHCPLRQVRFLSSFLFPCLGQTLFLARSG